MSSELYDRYAQIMQIDNAIEEAESEIAAGAKPISVKKAMKELDKKYYGKI